MSALDMNGTGPHVLLAVVHGDDMPSLFRAAVAQARELYGPDKALRVGHALYVTTSPHPGLGKFEAKVPVESVDYIGAHGDELPVIPRLVRPEVKA